MTKLDSWLMARDIETFRNGINAFRNARDLAKLHRDAFIRVANARAEQSATELARGDSSSMKRWGQDTTLSSAPTKRQRTSVSSNPSRAIVDDAAWRGSACG